MNHPLLVPVILNCNDEYWLPYCLEATRGFFDRYVIYDIGSTDRSKDIIRWFSESVEGKAEFLIKSFDDIVQTNIQGIFRNSMIAEARSEWYYVLDSDEIYTPESWEAIWDLTDEVDQMRFEFGQLYGIVPRIEIAGDLKSAYGMKRNIPHHRIYHRTAIWRGPHPGEIPYYPQKPGNTFWVRDATCYHFHNAERSTKDALVPKRLERRAKGTYRPGTCEKFDLFETLPILREPIADFEPSPTLKRMQDDQM